MKKTAILLLSLAMICLSACTTDYYEPVFGYDNLPAIIPASGGTYLVEYEYEYYATKAEARYFGWQYRVIVDGAVVSMGEIVHPRDSFFEVSIPANRSTYPKSVTVEASTHVLMAGEDWWGDWTPVCSSVQLSL